MPPCDRPNDESYDREWKNYLTPLPWWDKETNKNKETLDLKYALDQMDTCRIFHQQWQNTHSSQAHMEHSSE